MEININMCALGASAVAIVSAIGYWVGLIKTGRQLATAKRYLRLLHALLAIGFLCAIAVVVHEQFFTAAYVTWTALMGVIAATVSGVFMMSASLWWRVGFLHGQVESLYSSLSTLLEVERLDSAIRAELNAGFFDEPKSTRAVKERLTERGVSSSGGPLRTSLKRIVDEGWLSTFRSGRDRVYSRPFTFKR